MRTNIWSVIIDKDEYLFSNYTKARAFYLENQDVAEFGPFDDEYVELEDGTYRRRLDVELD